MVYLSSNVIRSITGILLTINLSHGFVNSPKVKLSLEPGINSSQFTSNSVNNVLLNRSGNVIMHEGRRRKKSLIQLTPQETIETCVSIDSFAPQFLWLLMIVAPGSSITKNVMGKEFLGAPILLFSLVHLLIVVTAASQEGAIGQIALFQDAFDPSKSQLDGMTKLFDIKNFVAEEWPHVLVWDLFVGRAIWKDGIDRDIDTKLALFFCNFIGPPGLLIHAATCFITKKGLPKM